MLPLRHLRFLMFIKLLSFNETNTWVRFAEELETNLPIVFWLRRAIGPDRRNSTVWFSLDSVKVPLEKRNKTLFDSLDPRIVLLVLGVGVSDTKSSPVASFAFAV
jgi:hypothetical protein